jgi:NAD(P)-dependent dehydrogenase (short-subunit alcohol dehydrogenase family)
MAAARQGGVGRGDGMSAMLRRVLITGSTRGIGRATAERMARDGDEIILHGRRTDEVEMAVAALSGRASAVRGVAGDLGDRAALSRIAAEAGDVDVLVNCAGIYREMAIGEVDEAGWDETIAVNLTAPWLLTRNLLPGLRQRRGVVINVASDAGLLGFAGGSVYCASKGGLIGLTKALAVELAPTVRAICVCPGPVETHMMHQSIAEAPDPDAARRQWDDYTHLKRVAQPHEIAAVIAFAASESAGFATGAVWLVDGGVTAGRKV